MRKYQVFAVLLVLMPQVAFASEECAKLNDNLERLNCYDAMYRSDSSANPSQEDAFTKFDKLTKSSKPPTIVHSAFDDCRLYFRQFELAKYSSEIWQIEVDLRQVDLGKTGPARADGVDIVVSRGKTVNYSHFKASRAFGSDKGPEWDVPLTAPTPSEWQRQISSAALLQSLFPPPRGGSVNLQTYQERSVTWRFWKAYPEDRPEITDAFLSLAKACVET